MFRNFVFRFSRVLYIDVRTRVWDLRIQFSVFIDFDFRICVFHVSFRVFVFVILNFVICMCVVRFRLFVWFPYFQFVFLFISIRVSVLTFSIFSRDVLIA